MSFALEPALDHHRAFLIMVIEHLAMKALNALVRIDVSFRMDGLHRTFVSASLAGNAAFAIPPQPVKQAETRRNGESGAHGAEIAAEGALHEEARCDHGSRVQNERPLASEPQDDRGLEGFDFRHAFGEPEIAQLDAEQHQKNHVFQRCQALMGAK